MTKNIVNALKGRSLNLESSFRIFDDGNSYFIY